MLILTRYNNQRIVVIAPDKSELWIEATIEGLRLNKAFNDNFTKWEAKIGWLCESGGIELSGQTIVVTHLETRGKSKPQHRIGIDAPKDYLILREELLNVEPAKSEQVKLVKVKK